MKRKEDPRFIRGQGTLRRRPQAARGCCTAPCCAARSRTRASCRSTPPRRWRTRRCAPSSPARTSRGSGLAWMPTMSADTQAVLATDKVRFQGQEVAFVVAERPLRRARRARAHRRRVRGAAGGRRRAQGARRRRAGHPRRQGGRDRQPHLRLGGRRRGRGRRACSPRADVVVVARHDLPALPPGADGDLRRGRPMDTVMGQLDAVDDDPGAARAPHGLRARRRAARAQDPRSSPATSAAASATRCRSTRATSARSSARSSPASR